VTSYASVAEFKAAVGVDDTVDDANIQRALDAGRQAIDNYCGRVFDPQDTVPSARVFDASTTYNGNPPSTMPFSWFYGGAFGFGGYDRLSVPDVGRVDAIDIDVNWNGSFAGSLPAGTWMLYPLNVGSPATLGNYTEIRLRYNAPYAFLPGYQIRVTGLWGWPTADAPPDPVREANILLANRFFRRPSAPFGVWEGPQLGQLAVLPQRDPDVVQLLDPYQGGRTEWVVA
jgi:Phage gp6-like head-tail connector protein